MRIPLLAALSLLLASCSAATPTSSDTTGRSGASGTTSASGTSASTGTTSGVSTATTTGAATTATSSSTTSGSGTTASSTGTGSSTSGSTTSGTTGGGCGTCPPDYTCGTANGLPVCRAPSGIPLFTHVFVIVMENLSLATMQGPDGGYPLTPYLASLAEDDAFSINYHGVTHPSLPNYIAMTSGEDVSGIACDCQPTGTACTGLTCNAATNLTGPTCGCVQTTSCIADDLEDGGLAWRNYAEDLNTPCNVTAAGNYAPKHVPFLYYPQIQTNATRCDAHVIDFATSFSGDLASAAFPSFAFISPNLVHDMHNPTYPSNGPQNQVNGDTWLGDTVPGILNSDAYLSGGVVFIVWDEDDDSGGLFGSDDPIPFFVLSPLARHGGYQSGTHADHYALLATFEDGLGLPRAGQAVGATPLTDFFPSN